MSMQIQDLKEHVDDRFDKVEIKLDTYMEQTVKNTQDLTWIKTSGSIMLTLIVIPTLLWLVAKFIGM